MKKRVKFTAVEVEQEMQRARELRIIDNELVPFVNGIEKSTIKDKIEDAKQKGRMGDKIQMVVNPMYIHIPEWQRTLRVGKALSIGNNYCSAKWDAPKLIAIEDKLYCVDGMHRIYGAFKAGITNVVCEFLEISEMEAIDLFLSQTEDRSHMTPSDYYRAAIAGGKEDYINFRNLCIKHNVQIKGDDCPEVNNPVGIWTSIYDGIEWMRTSPVVLERMLKILGETRWNGANYAEGKAYAAKTVRVLKKLYAHYKGKEDMLESALKDVCSGTQFFNDQLYILSQAMMFDYLDREIQKYEKTISAKKNVVKLNQKVN